MLFHIRWQLLLVALLVLFTSLLLTFVFGVSGVLRNPSAAVDAAAPVPAFKHMFVIVLENRSYDQVISSHSGRYLSTLADQYGLATQYYGVARPSLPNYMALTGGDTFGITHNCTDCFVDRPNIADQIEAHGRTWKAYMESMPSPCFVGDAAPLYRQKHNPFIYYDSIRTNPARCMKIVPFSVFADDLKANTLPDFSWITPNMCNDGHNCSMGDVDSWLKIWVPAILSSPEWQDQGVLFITFDEGDAADDAGCCQYARGGQVATLVISPLSKPGFRSTVSYTHYSLLRTIESAWQLPLLGHADCTCSPTMADFFTPVSQ